MNKGGWWTRCAGYLLCSLQKASQLLGHRQWLEPLFNCLSLLAHSVNLRAGPTRLAPALLLLKYPTCHLPGPTASFPRARHSQPNRLLHAPNGTTVLSSWLRQELTNRSHHQNTGHPHGVRFTPPHPPYPGKKVTSLEILPGCSLFSSP